MRRRGFFAAVAGLVAGAKNSPAVTPGLDVMIDWGFKPIARGEPKWPSGDDYPIQIESKLIGWRADGNGGWREIRVP